ncbi:MAG: hypothetical protein LBE56_10395 [Tannerella sp.]|jgi:hypothetical protein|nr:hypothetical protein [Tannerella sp.]
MKKKQILLLSVCVLIILLSCSYITWNQLDPQFTCAQCHEISPSHAQWTTSAHADIKCSECHGTATSDGITSFVDKANMVWVHFTNDRIQNADIHLNERQVMDVHNRCIACHQSEHAGWLASGHGANYGEIFMDSVHNAVEKPYWDCLRCHGMFYDGNINDLMDLESISPADWQLRDKQQEELPTMPCLACHQMHTDNPVSERYVRLNGTSRSDPARNPRTALYIRGEKRYLRTDMLSQPAMYEGDSLIQIASDPNTLLCMQCHAPNAHHIVGSEDDCTVTGAHQGISCIACHRPHSGETQQSCMQCHPSLTDEQIKMVYEQPHTFVKVLVDNR